jgi:arsenate reductase
MMRVLFICWHNSARSQMAAALLEKRTRHAVSSAGTHAAASIHPLVVEVMREIGIDLHRRWPHQLTNADVTDADIIIRCLAPDPDDYPWPKSSARFIEWTLPLPADESAPTLVELRTLRDTIATYVDVLAQELS